MRALFVLSMLLLAACEDPPAPLAEQGPPLPEAALGHFGASGITVRGTVISDRLMISSVQLCILGGAAGADTYEATRVVVCDTYRRSSEAAPYYYAVSPCTGGARFSVDTWTLDLHGSEACERFDGVHTNAAPPPDPGDAAFVAALAGLETLRASEAPCPVALRAPDAEIASGDSPGEAALHHVGEGTGEAFEVIHADVGGPLPTRPESPARYQAVYVRAAHTSPAIDPGGSTFTPGSSRGTAYLVDTTEGRVVCMGEVAAQNGDAMRGSSEAMAEMWLTLQLGIAEERAIALGLHAVAE
ncbi:MAG: hypothetical protein U0234_08490 [Sandaracinus sp.]